MAKPLTQKQLKAMLEKSQAALENTKKTFSISRRNTIY
jgi:hypothetical protein